MDHIALDILLLIGLTVLVAFMVGRLMRRLGIPQVVGFILAGLALGPSLLHVIPVELVENLDFVSELALGLIGFEMGLHLRLRKLRNLGFSLLVIVLFQAFLPFILVAGGVILLTGNTALGLLLGVLATATAPAATVDVLEEYKTDGPVTTSVIAVVGLDDALALILFSLVVPLVSSNFGHVESPSLLEILEVPFVEIGGSILVGILLGLPLAIYINKYCENGIARVVTIAVVFICAGLSRSLGLSLILTTMTLGVFIVNAVPRITTIMHQTIEEAAVIYILFFALVGARFEVLHVLLNQTALLLGAAYILLRALGKYGGTWVAGYLCRCDPVIRNNVGLALLSQAGVAIGLALSIAQRFAQYGPEGEALGTQVLTIVTATTFVVQLVGPILVKVAVSRAGEIGRAITQESVTTKATAR